MRRYYLAILFIISVITLDGQTARENLLGKVSFVSTQNIYVKFKSTEGISAGDTLFISQGEKLIGVLTVNNLSSVSCVCTSISSIPLPVEKAVEEVVVVSGLQGNQPDSIELVPVPPEYKTNIRGAVSVASYTDITNSDGSDSQRFRYTFSLNARNIANSKLSFESYMSFRHKAGEWDAVKDNFSEALKIYSLSAAYSINNTIRLSLGRKINERMASVGAIDGIQVEKTFKWIIIGAVAGFRPDYEDYGFNSKLLQYGAYIAKDTKTARTYTQSSLAFMQQMNGSETDRRFLYLQHSNSLVKNLRFFGTLEADLYALENDKPTSTFSITGLYLSLRYVVTKDISLTGSYDARKNVIYYETYKTFNDRILESEMRQGYRLSASWRMSKKMTFALQSGYRFLKADPVASKNVTGFFTYSQIPGLNFSATFTGTYLISGYMNGYLGGLNLHKDFSEGKFQAGIGYHYVNYLQPENNPDITQHIGEVNFYWQMFDKTSMSVNYEGTYDLSDTYNRLYVQLRQRF